MRQKREPSRRCGTFLRDTNRSQPPWHRARANQARVLRLLPRDSECRRVFAARATRRWLGIRGRSWHIAPRFCAGREKHLAVAAPFDRVKTGHIDRSTARTRSKLECCASIPETASADAPVLRDTRGAGLKFEVAAGTSHHGRAPKERAVSPVRHLSMRHEPITASAAPRAREASSRAASPPQRQRAPPRLCRASHAALASSLRPQLAHRTTVLRRRREASRCRSAI